MPRQCIPINANGIRGFACTTRGRRPEPKQCVGCGLFVAELLCDGPPAPSSRKRTCDAFLCSTCALEDGPDRHLCPKHRAHARQPQQTELSL